MSKYVKIELNDINIAHEKRDGIDMLELNITLPESKRLESSAIDLPAPTAEA